MTIAAIATPDQSLAATDAALIRAAGRIAERICADAWWNDDGTRCNWMGRIDEDGSAQSAQNPCSGALTGHLYSGSGGIALFLAELWRVERDPALARVARAALLHAIEQVQRPSDLPLSRLSFWVGDAGVAWVAARCADLAPDARAHVSTLLDRAAAAFEEKHILDVIGGTAGAIPALLELARDSEWSDRALSLARRFGDEICEKAKRGDQDAAAWDNEVASGFALDSPPLTGFSHGASGMAFALLLLHARTGDARYLEVARGAFTYEDALFDAAAGNWPDMRSYSQARTYQTAWCHGATGIGLARIAAMRVDSERAAAHAATVRIAAEATRTAIGAKLAESRADATLCHGIAGLADALRTFGEALDDELLIAEARAASLELIRRYSTYGDYPTAAPLGGANPALLTGHAGIGYHFLRAGAGAPPVLALLEEDHSGFSPT